MADFTSIAAVGSSLVRYLSHCFSQQQPLESGGNNTAETSVVLARTEDLDVSDNPVITPPCLSIFLYRVDFNSATRAAWSSVGQAKGRGFLPLECHFLMIPWGTSAEQEYRILGRTLQCLEDTPILTGPLLDPVTNWNAGDSVQVCLEDLSTEDLMRIFDSLPLDYKLCTPYMAKVLLLEGRRQEPLKETSNAQLRFSPKVTE